MLPKTLYLEQVYYILVQQFDEVTCSFLPLYSHCLPGTAPIILVTSDVDSPEDLGFKVEAGSLSLTHNRLLLGGTVIII